MPFVVIENMPDLGIRQAKKDLKQAIIAQLAEATGIKTESITPIAHKDEFGPPKPGLDTVYVRVDSGMFVGDLDTDENREKATGVVARLVFEALNGVFGVECFVGDLDPRGKTQIHTTIKPGEYL